MHVDHKKNPLVLYAVVEKVIQEDELEQYVVFSSGIKILLNTTPDNK